MKGALQIIILYICLFQFSCVVLKSKHEKAIQELEANFQRKESEYQAKQQQLQDAFDKTQKELSTTSVKAETLEKQLDQTGKNLLTTTKQFGKLEAQFGKLRESLEQCQQEGMLQTIKVEELFQDLKNSLNQSEQLKKILAEREETYLSLMKSLKKMLDAGTINVEIIDGLITVQLNEKVLFDTNKSDLKPAGKQALMEMALAIQDLSDRRWQIGGHTDSTGSPEFNWRLSTQRALSVVIYLISQGIPSQSLSAAGFGQYQPKASNETEEGRALNRRIEVILIPNFEWLELPSGSSEQSTM